MRIQFLTKAERKRLDQFPVEIPKEDLITFFTLTENDLSQEEYLVKESDIVHISPCRFGHINKYGKYFFNVERERNRKQLRPLFNSRD